ncbi:MAG TPA: YdbL family protein [Solimonas sp.]
MKTWLALPLTVASAALAACVTINVYFPAAAAEKAADRIIDDVWGQQPQATPAAPATPGTPTSSVNRTPAALAVMLLDVLVPAAHAQQAPDIDASSPEISRLKTQMENRFNDLKPHLDSGVVGLTATGYVAVRDPAAVPLASRNAVRTLVANENADRAMLYREIAVANKQPDWEGQIRGVFSTRWIAKAASGWWYQDASGDWKQK